MSDQWCAGFFEGEGCIRANENKKRGYKVLQLTIAQTDIRPLQFFQETMGAGSVCGPYNYGKNRKPYWVFTAYATNAEQMMERMRPYLFQKREQADAALEIMKEYRNI